MKFVTIWMYYSMCTCPYNSNQLISAGEPFEVNELSLIAFISTKLYLHAINFSTLTTQAGDTFSTVCCSTCSGGFKNETVVVVRASTTLEIASMEYLLEKESCSLCPFLDPLLCIWANYYIPGLIGRIRMPKVPYMRVLIREQ